MKKLPSLLVVGYLLSGCVMSGLPSGIAYNGCDPHLGCQEKDYYLPGKGVWADTNYVHNKAKIGAMSGVMIGTAIGYQTGDPILASVAAVGGLIYGHEIGATFDKIDQLHATMVLQQSLNNNMNGQVTTWNHPQKNVVVNAMPTSYDGECREFVTSVQVGNKINEMKGTACKINGEWELREFY